MADMAVKYQTEKKEQAILLQKAEIQRKNIILWSVAALFLLVAALGISSYRRYRLKQQARLQMEILNQQEMATRAVIKAEEDERQRIARDLHDGVGQMMSAARMNLSAFESDIKLENTEQKISLEKIMGLVDESCREIRSVSHNMMPNALLKNSLASAVRDFIDKIDKRALKVHIYTEGLDERLDSNVETVLYRVIQECVNNVIKHAEASTLDISISRDKEGISATIEDNGRGFDTQDRSRFDGIGLKNIITRIEYLKGTVDFDSAPGRGTLVAIHVPLGE
jgi:signal transduction histidine kinase